MESQRIPILLNLVAAILGAFGQYYYKMGSKRLSQVPLYLNYPIFLGVFLFCVVMVLFVIGYKMGGRIGVVYPFYATTFIWGTLIGVLLEKEPWTWAGVSGLVFIMVGLVLIVPK